MRRPAAGEHLRSVGVPLVDLADRVAERNAAVWDQDFALDRGGRVRRIRADAHVLKDSAGQALGCIILLRDVSDRVLMEERVRRMERFVSLGTLAAGLHHEIKNPLTALSIHVQLLEKRLGDPVPTKPVDELIGVLKSEILRLNGVLDSFRDFASLQRLTLRPADVLELLEETVRLIGPQADQQHVEVTLRRPGVGPAPGAARRRQVQAGGPEPGDQRPGGDARRGRASSCGASARDGELRVEVTDTGPGIAPEIQQDLFKPYFSTKARGTGMGLALSEKVVSQHGGRIEFRTGPARDDVLASPSPWSRRPGPEVSHERRALPHPDRRRRAEHPLRAQARPGGGVVRGLDGGGRVRGLGTLPARCPISW